MFKEAYRLGSTQTQVLQGAKRLGLLSQSTRHDLLTLSREGKRLGQERGETGEACFEALHLENTRIRIL